MAISLPATIKQVWHPDLPTLLLSLHADIAPSILSGKKIIEYRRRFFKDKFQAFVYLTGKNGGLELFIQCAQPLVGSVQALTALGVVDNQEMVQKYFATKNVGYAIPILEVYQFPRIALTQLRNQFGKFTVPHSYLFLDKYDKLKIRNFLLQQPFNAKQINHWTVN